MNKLSTEVKRNWYLFLGGITCLILSVSLDMLSPQIAKSIVDDVITNGELEKLTRLLLMIGGIGIGRAVFQYSKEYLFDLAKSKIAVSYRKSLFAHLQSLSVNYFDKTNTGELMSRMKGDIDNVTNAFGFIGMLSIEVTYHVTLVVICMFRLSWKLAIFPVLAMILAATIAVVLEKKLDQTYEKISEENAELTTVAQENLTGVRTVKAFARENFEIKKFLSHNKRYYELNMNNSKMFIKYQPVFQAISRLLPVITLLFGGIMVINGEITLGTLTAFIAYCDYVVWPTEMVGWLANSVASAFASSKKLKKIYDVKPEITNPENPVILPQVEGHITFDHVSFSIDETDILKDISFDLPAGKTLGIMGATGSGKSSIISLLNRFYDTNEGSISVDGVNIKNMDLSQLRGSISTVMQKVFLFSDTIKENVKLGKHDEISDAVILDSLNKAQADEFVSNLENKEDTLIGERGVGLSGGQKQRLSIARAFSKCSPILVMDDSTSALDMETESAIQQTLAEFESTTKIIIAHRISAVRHADEIIFLEDGKIAERGTHEELMKIKGLYYETFVSQYGDFLRLMDNSEFTNTELTSA